MSKLGAKIKARRTHFIYKWEIPCKKKGLYTSVFDDVTCEACRASDIFQLEQTKAHLLNNGRASAEWYYDPREFKRRR